MDKGCAKTDCLAYLKKNKKLRINIQESQGTIVLHVRQKDIQKVMTFLSKEMLRVNLLLDIVCVSLREEKTLRYIVYSVINHVRFIVDFVWDNKPVPSVQGVFQNAYILQKEISERYDVSFLDTKGRPVLYVDPDDIIQQSGYKKIIWPCNHHHNFAVIGGVQEAGVVKESFLQTGFLHRNIEGTLLKKNFFQVPFYMSRLDLDAGVIQEYSWARVVESLLHITVPERAQWIRLIVSEIVRSMYHAKTLFAITKSASFPIIARQYFPLAKLFVQVMHMIRLGFGGYYILPGGVRQDLSQETIEIMKYWVAQVGLFIDFSKKWCVETKPFMQRAQYVGSLGEKEALSLGCTGPVLRSTGSGYDIRIAAPYDAYRYVNVRPSFADSGCVYARTRVFLDEMKESNRLVHEGIVHIHKTPAVCLADHGGQNIYDVWMQPKAMMKHCHLYAKGYRMHGQVYASVEGPAGEKGVYLSAQGYSAESIKVRPSTLPHIAAWPFISCDLSVHDVDLLFASLGFSASEADR